MPLGKTSHRPEPEHRPQTNFSHTQPFGRNATCAPGPWHFKPFPNTCFDCSGLCPGCPPSVSSLHAAGPPVTHHKSWPRSGSAGVAGDVVLGARAAPFQMRSFLVHHLSSSGNRGQTARKERETRQVRTTRNNTAWEKEWRWYQRHIAQDEVAEQDGNPDWEQLGREKDRRGPHD